MMNAEKLEGQRVASPIGNVTHYKLLRTLEYLGVDADKVNIVPMNGNEAAAALSRGDVAMACAFGGPIVEMKKHGYVLMPAEQQQAIGIRVFDVISVRHEFAQRVPGSGRTVPQGDRPCQQGLPRGPVQVLRYPRRGVRDGEARRHRHARQVLVPDHRRTTVGCMDGRYRAELHPGGGGLLRRAGRDEQRPRLVRAPHRCLLPGEGQGHAAARPVARGPHRRPVCAPAEPAGIGDLPWRN
ncbi:MAG: ABC transporter substrate-binding protein [Halofilum sp. (in: g-proteobacteria)]|nr:ABC transporter substrate-binding protein [Halofilum sp. (in: g-proteobacteria)]